jgi:Subtilase family/Bacterial pre-peptidase C-terminal domain
VLNYSFGFDTGNNQFAGLDRYVDYIIRNRFVTIIKSAGNSSTPQSPVTSPGKGYNVLTVGNYNDVNTASNTDDVMSATSRYGDPYSVYSDREKPEVVAPGVSINTTCISSSTCIAATSGTSLSAPHVAGCAALLMSRNSVLGVWPEAVRAILMASAVVNIEGSTRLSEIDGVGGIECDSADDIVSGVAGGEQHEVVTIGSFPRDLTFSASAGKTVRAVIAWDSTPDQPVAGATPVSDPLKADLELTVYAPNGTPVASSYSRDNSYEIVEFTASTTGVYTARVSSARFEGESEYLAFAWWQGTRERN